MQVWIGILPPRGVLRVWEIPWRRYFLRSPARSLPMVAGLIWRRNLLVSSSMLRCPCIVRFSTKRGMPPARRTGPRNVLALQIVIGAFCTAGPYRDGTRYTGVRVWQDQPREHSLPGGSADRPGAGHGRHVSKGTPWTHRSRPALQISWSSLPSGMPVP